MTVAITDFFQHSISIFHLFCSYVFLKTQVIHIVLHNKNKTMGQNDETNANFLFTHGPLSVFTSTNTASV